MALAPGTRLGSYEVHAAIGAGGMGEVYQARDTKLGRHVALKVVGEGFAHDPERVARFRREAQLLAALNHPHIATIHGLEEAPSTGSGQAALQFLVMELVEGETLADRLKSGPVPVDEALRLARQVADALQAAHEKGIIHRDLKPANIALTTDGQVKVLDFGLAKLAGPAEAGHYVRPDATASPTITSPAMMTGVGVILGTAAYMAPEQARGKEADKRSDIWSFGCVVYEMLAGKRAFDGEDVALVLASVLKGDPDWAALPPGLPKPIATLLRRCLEKERRARVPDIGAALFVLDEAGQLVDRIVERVEVPAAIAEPPARRRLPMWRRAIPPAAALACALVAGVGVWWLTRPAPAAVLRTTITTSGTAALVLQGIDRHVAITPDGSRVIYRGSGDRGQLVVRALNQLEPTVLSGLGTQARSVFTSPDGQWLGFIDGNALKKVAITGGSPVTIAVMQAAPRSAAWSEDGTIILATAAPDIGLQRVSAAGGETAVLTKPDPGSNHLWPEVLPGGEAVLFTIVPANSDTENAQIAVLDLRTGASKVVIRGGSHAHYVPSGHLVYGVAGTLRAVAFDLERLETIGSAVPVLEGVVTTAQGAADFGVATNGSLIYVPGAVGAAGVPIVSVDRQGRASPLPGLRPGAYRDVRVSPDGTRLAVATQDDVWIYDFARATFSRLTTNSATDTRMLWTPDARRIIFTSLRAGYPEIFWRSADGTGSDERLLARANDIVDLRGTSWSADGRQLLFTEVLRGGAGCAIGQVAIERRSDVKVLLKNEFCNDWAAVSPDGRWIAYESNVSGRGEIYVERYPELGDRQQISTAGGNRPVWSRNGRELFFSSLDRRQMFAVPVRTGPTLVAGRPQVLFDYLMLIPSGGSWLYDVTPDGRFIIIARTQDDAGSGAPRNLILVQNWFEELKRLVPVN